MEGNVRCQGDPVCPVTYGVSGYQSLGQLYDWCKKHLDQRCVSQAIWKSSWNIFVLRPWWASGDTGLCTADVYLWRRQELRVQREFPYCYSQSCFLSNHGFFCFQFISSLAYILGVSSHAITKPRELTVDDIGGIPKLHWIQIEQRSIGNDSYITIHSKSWIPKTKKTTFPYFSHPSLTKMRYFSQLLPPKSPFKNPMRWCIGFHLFPGALIFAFWGCASLAGMLGDLRDRLAGTSLDQQKTQKQNEDVNGNAAFF